MPLSKAAPRAHLHTREIVCRGYRRDDGFWDIEGGIVDRKTYAFDNHDRGGISAGEPLHHMLVRVTLDDELEVKACEVATEAGPYGLCGDIAPDYGQLRGLRIGPGWRRGVLSKVGGTGGCTHITDLLVGPVAVTAFQTIYPARQKRDDQQGGKRRPGIIDTCHALARSSPVVARQWPDFYEPAPKTEPTDGE